MSTALGSFFRRHHGGAKTVVCVVGVDVNLPWGGGVATVTVRDLRTGRVHRCSARTLLSNYTRVDDADVRRAFGVVQDRPLRAVPGGAR